VRSFAWNLPASILLMLLAAVFAHSADGQNRAGDSASSKFNPVLNYPQVEYVQATEVSTGVWRFDATFRYNDEGWGYYADAWQVIDPGSGKILGDLFREQGEGYQVQHRRRLPPGFLASRESSPQLESTTRYCLSTM
jgi:hypothetical protein